MTFTALQDERFGRRILEAFAVRRNFDERFACCGILWNDDGRQSLQTIVLPRQCTVRRDVGRRTGSRAAAVDE